MTWNSAADFFAMGGYGLYVWGSFGVCVAALALEPLLLRRRHQAIVRSLRRHALAEQENQGA